MKQDTKKNLILELQNIGIYAYTFRLEICKTLAALSFFYLLLALFEIKVLLGFGVFFSSLFGVAYFKWRNMREKGLINLVSPKTRELLVNRSLFDVYRDQIYFPYYTKIIGLFIKSGITKPHPDQLEQMFGKLPPGSKEILFTKGILHLAPEKLQKLFLQKQPQLITELGFGIEPVPQPIKNTVVVSKSYGKVNSIWDRRHQYQAEDVKTHELTVSKQLMIKINDRLQWRHIILLGGLLAAILKKTKTSKLKNIFIYNSSVMGVLLLGAMIVIKYKEPILRFRQKLNNFERKQM